MKRNQKKMGARVLGSIPSLATTLKKPECHYSVTKKGAK